MNIPVTAVFIGSLIGSLHCVGMCGGFVACCSGQNKYSWWTLSLYQLGRLITYSVLGLIAGIIGRQFDSSLTFTGIQHTTAILTGVLLIIWGTKIFYGSKSASIGTSVKFLKPIYKFIYSDLLSPNSRSLLLGLCSGLLPCGWLYSFVALAAASGSPLAGTVVMFFFWAGTVPILSAVGLASGKFADFIRPYQRSLVASLLILAGFWSLATHLALPKYFTISDQQQLEANDNNSSATTSTKCH